MAEHKEGGNSAYALLPPFVPALMLSGGGRLRHARDRARLLPCLLRARR